MSDRARAKLQRVVPSGKTSSTPMGRRRSPAERHSPRKIRILGNQAIQRWLRRSGPQEKLTVNAPGDRYEREADRIADRVLLMPAPRGGSRALQAASEQTSSAVQRQSAKPEKTEEGAETDWAPLVTNSGIQRQADKQDAEEETAQASPLIEQITPLAQRQEDEPKPQLSEQETDEEAEPAQAATARQSADESATPEEEEDTQARREDEDENDADSSQRQEDSQQEEEESEGGAQTSQRASDQTEEDEQTAQGMRSSGAKPSAVVAPASVQNAVRMSRGQGEPLSREAKGFFEPRFGADFSAVRIHTDEGAGRLSRRLNAQAFTVGRDIYFGSSRYDPRSRAGKRLIGHELTHVVQQRRSTAHRMRVSAGWHSIQRLWGLSKIGNAIGGAFKAAVRGVKAVAKGVAKAVSKGVDWVLGKLAPLAHKIPGYKLLSLILGRDPISKKRVPRNATNLIGGLLQLVGADTLFKSLQKSGAIEKAYKWLQEELTKLDLGWATIKALVMEAVDAFSITDIAKPSQALAKLKRIFGPPLTRIANFAKAVGKQIIRFIIQGVLTLAGPLGKRLWTFIQRGKGVISVILKDPLRFLGNVFKAVRKGFTLFGQRIWFHLKNALMGWLFGTLQGAGLELPEKLDFKGIVSILLQIFGLTYANLKIRLVRRLGEKKVEYLEKSFGLVKILVTEGLAGTWKRILTYVGSLPDMLIGAVRGFIIEKIVKVAVTKLATMFNPAGLIAQGLIALYNTVMFLVERFQQMLQLAESILQSVESIAAGKITKAAQFVEKTLGRLLTLVISFLARITIGDVVAPLKKAIKTLQAPVLRAMDKLVDFIVKKAKKLTAKVKGAAGKLMEWWGLKKKVGQGKDAHTLKFESKGKAARLVLASRPAILETFLRDLPDATKESKKKEIAKIKEEIAVIQQLKTGEKERDKSIGKGAGEKIKTAFGVIAAKLEELSPSHAVPPSDVEWTTWEYDNPEIEGKKKVGEAMEAKRLSLNPGRHAGSAPQASQRSKLFKEVNRRQGAYIQGHLLNDNVHGPGTAKNLVPLESVFNTAAMEQSYERHVKRLVLNEKRTVYYKVKANWDSSSSKHVGHPAERSIPAERRIPSSVTFEMHVLKDSGGAWVKDAKASKNAGDRINSFSETEKMALPADAPLTKDENTVAVENYIKAKGIRAEEMDSSAAKRLAFCIQEDLGIKYVRILDAYQSLGACGHKNWDKKSRRDSFPRDVSNLIAKDKLTERRKEEASEQTKTLAARLEARPPSDDNARADRAHLIADTFRRLARTSLTVEVGGEKKTQVVGERLAAESFRNAGVPDETGKPRRWTQRGLQRFVARVT